MAIKLLDESIVNEDKGSYVVKRVIFDVAFKDEDHCRRFAFVGGAGNRDVANAIFSAVEEAGFELAGDIIESTDDLTDTYRSNDYYDFYGIKDYLVKRVEIDVAARDEEHAKKLNSGFGAPTKERSLFNCLDDALEKCGYEMAGDGTSCEDDYTDVYRDNDYEFFTECDKIQESEEEVLHKKSNGDYLVKSSSGHGWTAYNRSKMAIGGIDSEDENGKERSDKDAIDLFRMNKLESVITEDDDDDYPLSTRSGTKFRKRNQSGFEGIIDINFPSFTVKYEVGDGLQFKNPKGLESNDDAVLKLVNGEDDRVAKIIKNAVIDAMKEKGFSAEAPHSVLIGLPATVRITKGVTESVESDEYKSYRDQWEKDYKDKNRSQKEIDDFITSAWNELNHGENRFTGDEFKKLCADAGVDHKKFMESINVGDKYDEYCTDCDTITTQKFKGNFKDGDKTIGRYVCCRCGCENDGEPSEEMTEADHYDMANPKDAEDINLDLVATLSVKTYEAVEALQRPRFRMKLRELVGGFGAELHECSVDETNPLED